MNEHNYKVNLTWTGNQGKGTSEYRGYERSHEIEVTGKPTIPASSDPSFRGDKTRYNPEDLLVASISSCHMLWYLHLCCDAGVVVLEYSDEATGTMIEIADGSGYFKQVTLYPKVTVSDELMVEKANELHHKANEMCFIANSVNFKIAHIPSCFVKN